MFFIIIPISQMKNLKWGMGFTQLMSGQAEIQIPGLLLSTNIHSFEETPLKTIKEKWEIISGGGHVLSCLKQKLMTLSSLQNEFLALTHREYLPSILCLVHIYNNPMGWIFLLVVLHPWKQQVAELGLFDADRLYLATVLFYLSGTATCFRLGCQFWHLTFCFVSWEGVDNTVLKSLAYTRENNFSRKGLGILM